MRNIFLASAREARRLGACWHHEAERARTPEQQAYALAMRARCHAIAARDWRYAQGVKP